MSAVELKEPVSKVDVRTGYPRLREPVFGKDRKGKFVAVRRTGEEHERKTLLGLYIGDLCAPQVSIEGGDTLVVGEGGFLSGNPAIYVPSLGQIVYGFESWWSVIESEDQLRDITDHDIDSAWYVRALRAMTSEKPEEW